MTVQQRIQRHREALEMAPPGLKHTNHHAATTQKSKGFQKVESRHSCNLHPGWRVWVLGRAAAGGLVLAGGDVAAGEVHRELATGEAVGGVPSAHV